MLAFKIFYSIDHSGIKSGWPLDEAHFKEAIQTSINLQTYFYQYKLNIIGSAVSPKRRVLEAASCLRDKASKIY